MQTLIQDVRYASRMLIKHPAFTAVAAITLGLGIGANSAIFSVVNTILLKALPYPNAAQLVLIRERFPKSELHDALVPVCAAELLDYQAGNTTLEDVAGFESITENLIGHGEPERIKAARVSASTFSILGIQAVLGRTFRADEDHAGKDGVAILGYGLWQRLFGSEPGIIGRTVTLNNRPHAVVGVMPSGFRFPDPGMPYTESAELWVPLALSADEIS